ncbi:hypothetical protein PUNSTDRAFT_134155 [Punctularia strigosozonata HHB-11173 SS5]|uniref:uncharacterized protein n=1 Tax=Punctularia strigosozonata (strain HHB-11173) TaxID=741275 RepID=UPI00044168E1|nr:uncharacterized protein PUNSTDRAFT_134155 [Punctularia strigosozonata HHB-11173 SS5]EIN08982.1 hypothetical protein PUNSTDRAFT_134155 [Punctularia strigosozonata HHB-11173 SS5]
MMFPLGNTEEYEKAWYKHARKHRRALLQLPGWMTGEHVHPGDCPLFHYGVAAPFERLRAYAVHKGFMKADADDIALYSCTKRITRSLMIASDATLHFACTVHPVHDYVIALHTNVTAYREKLVDTDEEEVVEIIKRELGLDPNTTARWYWDLETPKSARVDAVEAPSKRKTSHNTPAAEGCTAQRMASGVRFAIAAH